MHVGGVGVEERESDDGEEGWGGREDEDRTKTLVVGVEEDEACTDGGGGEL